MRGRVGNALRRTTEGARALSGRSTTAAAAVLVRDFQWDSLYHKDYGYFTQRTVVGHTREPIDFGKIVGQREWFRTLRRLYKLDKSHTAGSEVWFTPAELFRPHYSRAMATMVLKMFRHAAPSTTRPARSPVKEAATRPGRRQPRARQQRRREEAAPAKDAPVLRLFELGAGNGTNAAHMLDHIRDTAPDVYERCELWAVEVSAALSARQQAALDAAGHGAKLRRVLKDATTLAPEDVAPPPCGSVDIVVATEVLDNLPHDKVVWQGRCGDFAVAVDVLATELMRVEHSGTGLRSGSEVTRAAAVVRELERSDTPGAVGAALAGALDGWSLVSVLPGQPTEGLDAVPEFQERADRMFCDGVALPETDALAAKCLLRFVVAGAVARIMGQGDPRSMPVPSDQAERGGGDGDVTGSAIIRTMLEKLEVARSALQSVLYAPQEAEAPDGPWMPREREASGAATVSAALRGARLAPRADLSRAPPIAVPVPIATGDTARPLGESATLPALTLGAAALASAEVSPTHALAIMLPTAALRLVQALHLALPGHGLLAADFHALPGQPGGASDPVATVPTHVSLFGDGREPADDAVPVGCRRIRPCTDHDMEAIEFAPAAGTVNAAVVQSRDVHGVIGPQAGTSHNASGRDHPSYLTPRPRGRADIFFATDFPGLAVAWLSEAACGAESSADVAWQPHVLDAAGVADAGRTRSGFNPMLHDYANTSVLLGWPTPRN